MNQIVETLATQLTHAGKLAYTLILNLTYDIMAVLSSVDYNYLMTHAAGTLFLN